MHIGLSLGLGSATRSGGGAAAFDPLSLNPTVLFDPSDPATLFQDTAGTIPVTVDNQTVARAANKATGGAHFLQSTGAHRPIYRTAGGLHWIESDGVDDYMDADVAIAGASFYVAAAVRASGTPNYGRVLAIARNDTNDNGPADTFSPILRVATSATQWGGFHANILRATGNMTNGVDYIVESFLAGGQHVFSVDGADASVALTATMNTNIMRLFAAIVPQATAHAPARLSGLFAATTVPGAGDRARLRTFLSSRQGRTL